MKIAMLVSGHHVNGVTVHCRLLVKYLLSKGHEILLVHRKSDWMAAQTEFQKIKRFESSFTLRAKEILAVGEQILRFDADVIHTHLSTAHAYGAVYRVCGTTPVVATAHAMHFQPHWPFNHRVIATSYEAANYHQKYNFVPKDSIRIIPNFVDISDFRPPTELERLAARELFNLSANAFVIGFVGDLINRKRPRDLVKAFAGVAHARKDAVLLLIGGNKAKIEEIRRLAFNLGVGNQVIAPGIRNDVRQAFWAMDIFAHCSAKETGPLALLEAAATGLPVVATNVGMVSHFVVDGTSGYVVSVGDISRIAQSILDLGEDNVRRIQFGLAARRIVKTQFSIEILAPQVEAVLLEASHLRSGKRLSIQPNEKILEGFISDFSVSNSPRPMSEN